MSGKLCCYCKYHESLLDSDYLGICLKTIPKRSVVEYWINAMSSAYTPDFLHCIMELIENSTVDYSERELDDQSHLVLSQEFTCDKFED